MFLVRFLLVVLPLLTVARSLEECQCDYHAGGCAISKPAPRGFKCKCYYVGAWRCIGTNFPCREDEACPGNRYSYCACMQGGGDCGAYYHQLEKTKSCAQVNKAEASTSLQRYAYEDCECDWVWGGCKITKAAPVGFKCVCVFHGFFTCSGWSQGCDEDQYCPAGEYTHCGCRRGQGNCGGYPKQDTTEVCRIRRPNSSACNCTRTSDWTEGQYSVARVTFNTTEVIRGDPKPDQVGSTLDVPNASSVEQRQVLSFSMTTTTETTFEYTHGFALSLGVKFSAEIPIFQLAQVIGVRNSISFAYSTMNTYGERIINSRESSHEFSCSSPPYTLTRCKIFITRHNLTVPYTMYIEHNEIPDCECKSYGIWKGITFSNSELSAETVGSCNNLDSEGSCLKLAHQPFVQLPGEQITYAKDEPKMITRYLPAFFCIFFVLLSLAFVVHYRYQQSHRQTVIRKYLP